MAYDHEEQEQLDNLKAFWNRWGTPILSAVLVVALSFAGWNGWQQWQARQARQATGIQEQLQAAATANDAKRSRELATQLMNEYPRTVQATMGALLAARVQVDAGDAKSARPLLQWAADQASDEGWRHVARLRLAGLLLDEKAHDEALKLLTSEVPAAFAGAYADRRGDVLFAQGKTAEARAAWKDAMEKLGERTGARDLVRLKLDALGEEGA